MNIAKFLTVAQAVSLAGTSKGAGIAKSIVGTTGHGTANGLRYAADGVDWITDKAEAGCDIVADWAMAKVIDMANEAMQFEKFKQQYEAIDKNKTGDAKPQEESELRKKFEARKKAMKEAEAKTMPTEVEEDLIDDIEIITAI